MITKAINARNHGAKAVVLVNGKLGDGEEDLLTRFGSVSGPENTGIVLVQVKNDVADRWLQGGRQVAGRGAGTDQSFCEAAVVRVSRHASRMAIHVDIETTRATVNNVLAYLPGKTDEYVIVGAHYDHLGRGNYDSLAPSQIGQIHPGADDNASGTAGVLELARLFAPMKGKLQRGILFMSFAGEELGLLGSAYWVKHPTMPLDKAVAMLNMDMIGRIKDDKVYIGGVGTGSTLKPVLEQARRRTNFKIEYSPGGYAASDHTSFVTKHIPVLFFFSGLHSDYHKPSDTWDKINATSAARLLDVVADAARATGVGAGAPDVRDRGGRQAASQAAEAAATARTSDRFRIWAGGERREILRCEAGFAGGQGRVQGRRHPGAVRRQAYQESLRLHGRAAPQQGRRRGGSDRDARRQASEGLCEIGAEEVEVRGRDEEHSQR